MKKQKCLSCNQINEIDKIKIFYYTFEWFNCSRCDDVWVKSRYGEWLESNSYQEYFKTLTVCKGGIKMNERQVSMTVDMMEIRDLSNQLFAMTVDSTRGNRELISRMQNLVNKIMEADNKQK